MDLRAGTVVTDRDALRALYRDPVPRALAKESPVLTAGYAELVTASPFCVVATHGADGIDLSPRGDAPGFVRVLDERTLLLPDRRGNNRLDTLENVLRDSRIGLLFLVPGLGEAVRVRGTAVITADPELLAPSTVAGVAPVTGLVVTVSRVYFQCRRATLRSALWEPAQRDPADLPTPGRLQAEVGAMTEQDAREYDATVADYTAGTLYAGPTKP